ncbi:ATP-binding protein [Tepidiforma sp.]|uniref:AAA family ATPase n=1 Tax=Tepidiforma sp. TaxID=2682230 RepID=UPI002ADD7E81|nr:ATP-binding protein [Tepidiforma sp.]
MVSGNCGGGEGVLILLWGLPGAGKTTLARALVGRLGAVHVESDAVRKRLFPAPAYTADEHGAVFAKAEALAREALEAGRHVVFDATNLTRRDRRRFVGLARAAGAGLLAVRVTAPEEVLRQRLSRPREGYSDAGVPVLERMQGRVERVEGRAVVVDSRFPFEPTVTLIARLVEEMR